MIVGIDVSKDTLEVALPAGSRGRFYERSVCNDASGYVRLLEWVKERSGSDAAQLTVMLEATGVYHEAAALALHEAGCRVIVANPKRVHDYARGLGLLSKTDRVDARALVRYGQQAEELVAWQPPAPEVRLLRALYVRLQALEQDLRRELNRQGQASVSSQPQPVLISLERSIERLREECAQLKRAIEDHYDQYPGLKSQRELLQTIPGIGPISADRMLCVLLRQRFSSARQAAAFAGLVPRLHQSGTSVHKSARLSKQGDPKLRATLYMAAVVASRHNRELRQHYQRLLKAGKAKMSALGALMRRLLHIAFGIIKSQTPYNPNLVAVPA